MKIGMVTTWHTRCGIASYSAKLVRALADLGVDIYVVRMSRFGSKTPQLMEQLVQSVPVDKVDLIHVQNEFGLFQGLESPFYRSLQGLGRPVVTTLHATGSWEKELPVCGVSKKIVVHNEYCRKLLSCKDKAVVIPHGCEAREAMPRDEARKLLGIPDKAKIVGYCGYISPVKGLETAVEALMKVPGVAFLVSGGWHTEVDTQYIDGLRRRSAELLPGRIQYLGYLSDERLSAFYGAVDFCLYPSRFASESGALLMALGFGKAVLASDLPPFREKAEHGVLATFESIADLAEWIEKMFEKEDVRKGFEKGARAYVEENSWLNVAAKHISLYGEILGEAPH